MVMGIHTRIKNVVATSLIPAFKHGYQRGMAEGVRKGEDIAVDLDADAKDTLRVLHAGVPMTGSYKDIPAALGREFNKILAEAFIEQPNLYLIKREVMARIDKQLNLSMGAIERIARTELINISNEGRLKAYQRREKEQGEQFRYTLVVARGVRTCEAHRAMATWNKGSKHRIPKKGLILNDLIELQMKVGAKYGMKLQGNQLLHPNQRTVFLRAV